MKFLKDLLIGSRIAIVLYPLQNFFSFLSYFSKFMKWIGANKGKLIKSDYYRFTRNYEDRYKNYTNVLEHYKLQDAPIVYLEFGVASAASFKWWLAQSTNDQSSFYGFDTFEGLPEDWGGFYKKNDMAFGLPDITDDRASFYKGVFQDTMPSFIEQHSAVLKRDMRKVIHLDADLFSSTIFVLSQLYPYLKKGDIVMFDEFSVANHEFKAYDIFTKSFYVNMEPRFAVNNFYQTAFEVV